MCQHVRVGSWWEEMKGKTQRDEMSTQNKSSLCRSPAFFYFLNLLVSRLCIAVLVSCLVFLVSCLVSCFVSFVLLQLSLSFFLRLSLSTLSCPCTAYPHFVSCISAYPHFWIACLYLCCPCLCNWPIFLAQIKKRELFNRVGPCSFACMIFVVLVLVRVLVKMMKADILLPYFVLALSLFLSCLVCSCIFVFLSLCCLRPRKYLALFVYIRLVLPGIVFLALSCLSCLACFVLALNMLERLPSLLVFADRNMRRRGRDDADNDDNDDEGSMRISTRLVRSELPFTSRWRRLFHHKGVSQGARSVSFPFCDLSFSFSLSTLQLKRGLDDSSSAPTGNRPGLTIRTKRGLDDSSSAPTGNHPGLTIRTSLTKSPGINQHSSSCSGLKTLICKELSESL